MAGKRTRRTRWKPVDLTDVFCVVSPAGLEDADAHEDTEDDQGQLRSPAHRPRPSAGHRANNGCPRSSSCSQHTFDEDRYDDTATERKTTSHNQCTRAFVKASLNESYQAQADGVYTNVIYTNSGTGRVAYAPTAVYGDGRFYTHHRERNHYISNDRWHQGYQGTYRRRGENGTCASSSYSDGFSSTNRGYQRNQYYYNRKLLGESGYKRAQQPQENCEDAKPSQGDRADDEVTDNDKESDSHSSNGPNHSSKADNGRLNSHSNNYSNYNNASRRYAYHHGYDRRDNRYHSNFGGSPSFHHRYGGSSYRSFGGFREQQHPFKGAPQNRYQHGQYRSYANYNYCGRSDRYHYNKEDYRKESTDTSETSSTTPHTDPMPVTGVYINGLWIPSSEVERMVINGELPPPPFGPSIPPSIGSEASQGNIFYFYALVKKESTAVDNSRSSVRATEPSSQCSSGGDQNENDSIHSTDDVKIEQENCDPASRQAATAGQSDEYIPVLYASAHQPPLPRRLAFRTTRRIRRRKFLDNNYVDLESDNCDIITKVTSKNYRFILSLEEASDQEERVEPRRPYNEVDAGADRTFCRDRVKNRNRPECSGSVGSVTPPASDYDKEESSDPDRENGSLNKADCSEKSGSLISEEHNQDLKPQSEEELRDPDASSENDTAVIPHTQIESTLPTVKTVSVSGSPTEATQTGRLDDLHTSEEVTGPTRHNFEMFEEFAERTIDGAFRDAIEQVRSEEDKMNDRLNQPGCSGITPAELYAEQVARQIVGGIINDSGRRRPPPIVIEDSINANPSVPVSVQEESVRQRADLMASEIIKSALQHSKKNEPSPREIVEKDKEERPASSGRLAGVRNALKQGVKEGSDFLGEGATSPGRGEAFPTAPTHATTATIPSEGPHQPAESEPIFHQRIAVGQVPMADPMNLNNSSKQIQHQQSDRTQGQLPRRAPQCASSGESAPYLSVSLRDSVSEEVSHLSQRSISSNNNSLQNKNNEEDGGLERSPAENEVNQLTNGNCVALSDAPKAAEQDSDSKQALNPSAERKSGSGVCKNAERSLLLQETSIISYGSGRTVRGGQNSTLIPLDSGVQSEVDDDEHVVFAVTPSAALEEIVISNGVKSATTKRAGDEQPATSRPLLQNLANRMTLFAEVRTTGFPFGFCCSLMWSCRRRPHSWRELLPRSSTCYA